MWGGSLWDLIGELTLIGNGNNEGFWIFKIECNKGGFNAPTPNHIVHCNCTVSRFSRVLLCATPEMAAHQAPPSLGFSRQEHWSGLPCPSPMHESEK